MSDRLRNTLGIALLALALAACVLAYPFGKDGRPDTYCAQGLPRVEARPIPVKRGTVRVNTSDVSALTVLKGVGPAIAEAIAEERDAHGDYRYPEDLLAVKGVGAKKLADFRDELDLSMGGD